MPKLRYLKVRFSNELKPWEMPCFRAAVIEATRRQSTLFHNHRGDAGFLYRYPKIQYKLTQRKASIICLGEGTDDIHYLLANRSLRLRIGEREEDFAIEDVQLKYHQLQTWQGWFNYSVKNWQALNQENFKRYSALQGAAERIQFLEKMLLGNLLAFAKTMDVDKTERPIEVQITKMKGEKWLKYKGRRVLTFDLNCKANVSLPDHIGLGKGVSVGFGNVKRFGKPQSEMDRDPLDRGKDMKRRSAQIGNRKYEIGSNGQEQGH